MRVSEQPDTVTLVASPPPGTSGPTDNAFIDDTLATLSKRTPSGRRVVRASSVRDIDLELGKILHDDFRGVVRVQIVGHSISGMLSLGASWIPDCEMQARALGYAINGRTLTYTLSEMLRCLVRGADDVVSPDEFDTRGWYTPGPHHRRPKGWPWVE